MNTENICERLRSHARDEPNRLFCTFQAGDRREPISFGDLYERSMEYSRQYAAMGVERGDLVIVILQHTPHLFYSYLGAMIQGAIPSFMPFQTPKQRADIYWADHEALFQRVAPKLIVTYRENAANARALLPNLDVTWLIAGEEPTAPPLADAEFAGFAAAPDDVACLQHSSGTTSLKRGVMLTHRAILDEVALYSRALGFGRDDVTVSWLPLYHDMGFVACFLASVVEGSHLVALDPFEWTVRPRLLLDAIERYRATFCWLPNFAYSHIANTAPPQATWDLSSIRAIINCSEPCKAQTFERFADRFRDCGAGETKLQVCYAMAENVFAVTQTEIGLPVRVLRLDPAAFSAGTAQLAAADDPSIAVVSCGTPIEGVSVRIRDAQRNDVETAVVGEIHVTSPFLFNGYYKLPEKTSERLRDGWYATGDMGFVFDGELYVTGRIDDMLIIAGRNYYAHEIERIVNAVEGVMPGRCIAIGVADPNTDATVVVVLAECAREADLAKLPKNVRRLILETLGLAIHSFVPLETGKLIKTTSGKISRNKNKELYEWEAF